MGFIWQVLFDSRYMISNMWCVMCNSWCMMLFHDACCVMRMFPWPIWHGVGKLERTGRKHNLELLTGDSFEYQILRPTPAGSKAVIVAWIQSILPTLEVHKGYPALLPGREGFTQVVIAAYKVWWGARVYISHWGRRFGVCISSIRLLYNTQDYFFDVLTDH